MNTKVNITNSIQSAVFIALFLMFASHAAGQVKPDASSGKPLPENIMSIIDKSCMDCHSDDGNKLAAMKLNFSNWEKYKPGKQAAKSAAICKIVGKGNMPPKSYRESHPDAVLTKAQIEMICKWSESLRKK